MKFSIGAVRRGAGSRLCTRPVARKVVRLPSVTLFGEDSSPTEALPISYEEAETYTAGASDTERGRGMTLH